MKRYRTGGGKALCGAARAAADVCKRDKRAAALIAFAACIYAAFLAHDLFLRRWFALSNALKFAGLLACLLLAVNGLCAARGSRDARLQVAALGVTALADVFLLFTDAYAVGISIFCFAHVIYIARFTGRVSALAAALAACALLASAAFGLSGGGGWMPLVAGALYAALLMCSVRAAFHAKLPGTGSALCRAGMLLLVLCDINVALYNLLPPGGARVAAGVMMWFFYLPSQLSLALSAYPNRENRLRRPTSFI